MAVKFRDYYEVLGVGKTATDDEIRKAYRALARKHHPDVNPGDKSAEDKFKEINEAYEVLSDPEKRNRYDQLGSNTQAGSDFNPPPGWGPPRDAGFEGFSAAGDHGSTRDSSDFFESLFGKRRNAREGHGFRMRGNDVDAEITLSLEEAHRGTKRNISFDIAGTCPTCNGSGEQDGKTCPTCHGMGVVLRPKSLDVTIPAGVRQGSIVRLAGQGEPGGNGGSAGDLLLHVRIQPHHRFEVIGDDVEIEIPIAPWEAALGAKINVPTLDGTVEMKIPQGSQGGRKLRLRGIGLSRRSGGKGDEYVRLKIVIPTELNVRQKELFEQLAGESQFDPRKSMDSGQGR